VKKGSVKPDQVKAEIARHFIGEDYDRLVEKYGETVVVDAFIGATDGITSRVHMNRIRRRARIRRWKERIRRLWP